MSYRIRFTFPNGTTGVWALAYPTREAAQNAVREREADTGLAYTVEEVAEPGSTAAHHVEILRERVKELEEELARAKPSLTKATSVPVGASEAPGEGGDSDRRRLEALRAFLEGNEDASVSWWEGEFNALAEGEAITAPTLLSLADKLAEKETKP